MEMSAGMKRISDNNDASSRALAQSLRGWRPDCCQARTSTAIWPNVRKNVKPAISFFWIYRARACALLRAKIDRREKQCVVNPSDQRFGFCVTFADKAAGMQRCDP